MRHKRAASQLSGQAVTATYCSLRAASAVATETYDICIYQATEMDLVYLSHYSSWSELQAKLIRKTKRSAVELDSAKSRSGPFSGDLMMPD